MKPLKAFILLVMLTLGYLTSYCQPKFSGHWKVSCYLERNTDGSLDFCGICPLILGKTQMDIQNFEMVVDNDKIQIMMDKDTTHVSYTWDSKLDAISFEFKKTLYTYKILRGTSTDQYILKDKGCGGLMLLNRL